MNLWQNRNELHNGMIEKKGMVIKQWDILHVCEATRMKLLIWVESLHLIDDQTISKDNQKLRLGCPPFFWDGGLIRG